MLNIVIPMAGAGSRFSNAGYKDPKPFIKVHDMPMIELVIKNLSPTFEHRFIFICQTMHVQKYEFDKKLKSLSANCDIVMTNGLTEGAACSVLLAKNLINNNDELMIANSDQFIDIDINTYLKYQSDKCLDGLIMTMWADDPKWSFAEVDQNNLVTKVVEKEVISNEATVGIYNFRCGSDFVIAAEEMIKKDLRVNNEFYVAPTYNQLVAQNKKIGIYNVGEVSKGMYGLGTPDDLNLFIESDISRETLIKYNENNIP